jgi:hypothetical protein
MKLHRYFLVAGTLVTLPFVALAFPAPSQTPPSGNTLGPAWLQPTGLAPSVQNGIIYTKEGRINSVTTTQDVYVGNGKSIRLDQPGLGTFNFGNYGNGATGLTLGVQGSLSIVGFNNNGLGTLNTYQICFNNGVDCRTTWPAGGGGVGGSGTTNYVPLFTAASTLGNSLFTQNGTSMAVGTAAPAGRLDVQGTVARTGTHPTSQSFYVSGSMGTGQTGPAAGNIEFKHDNGSQGIGFGYNTIYQAGSNPNQDLNFLSKGTSPITLNAYAYGTGHVGVGTASPSAMLTVQDANLATFTTNSSFGSLLVQGGAYVANNVVALDFKPSDVGYTKPFARIGMLETGTGSYLQFGTSNVYATGITNTAMTIDPAGKVGIGTTAPGALLDLSNTTQLSNRIRISGQEYYQAGQTSTNGIDFRLGTNRTNERQLWIADSAMPINGTTAQLRVRTGNGTFTSVDSISTDGTTVMPLSLNSTGGKVGVGIAAPTTILDVRSTSQFDRSAIYGNGTVVGVEGESAYDHGVKGTGAAVGVEGIGGTYGLLGTGTSYGVYTSSPAYLGNVNIHTTGAGAEMGDAGFGNTLEALRLGSSSGMNTTNYTLLGNSSGNTYLNAVGTVYIRNNNNDKLWVDSAGPHSSTGGWVASDLRLKENIKPFSDGLDQLTALNPIQYNFKSGNAMGLDSTQKLVGIGAQDLQKVMPEAVLMNSQGYLEVKSDVVIWAMVNSIKELKSENDSLKSQVSDLTKRLDAIEAKLK